MSANRFLYAKEQLKTLNPEAYTSLIDMFQEACEKFAANPAFSCFGHQTSYSEIDKLSRDFAAYLRTSCGLEKGDRIAIQLPNISQYPIVAWGALRAGLTVVNTNPMYTPRELKHQFNDSGVKALVILSDLLASTEAVVPETGIETVIVTNVFDLIEPQPLPATGLPNVISLPEVLALGAEQELPAVNASMDDMALLQYTGGTTGVAKGAVLTQGNLFAGMRMSEAVMKIEDPESEVIISPMPLYHIYGFTLNLVAVFMGGGMSVLIPDPRDINSLIQHMKDHKFTGLAGVNTLFTAMLAHPEFDEID